MKLLLAVSAALALAGCVTTVERAATTWYPEADVVCRVQNCPRCHGGSLVGCLPCNVTGKVPCTACRDGKERCGACNGDGHKGGKKCKTCNGDGIKKCSRCRGDRWMACPACLGKARVHCMRHLVIHEPMPVGDDAWPPGNSPQ